MAGGFGFKPEFLADEHENQYPPMINMPMPNFNNEQMPAVKTFCNGYYWVSTSTRSSFPSTALEAGRDSDGTRIYVGRAYHEGDWVPAKVIPEKSIAYIAYGGEEHPKHEFEVLCEQRFDWVHSSGGQHVYGAVVGGRTSEGEDLYIGRVYHNGSQTVGKVHTSHGVCYIPYGGEEISFGDYEILVLRD